MNETTGLLRDLVAIPSVNPMGRPLQGPEIYEHGVTAYLERFFRSLGVPFERQPVAPLRENIVAWCDLAGPGPTLVFEAHQDTVPTDQMTIEPFGARIDGNRLYGRGACDIKGGMAAMLAAFARVVRDKPASGVRRLVMACSVDEEFTFLGVRRLAQTDWRRDHAGPNFAIVAEPTQLRDCQFPQGLCALGAFDDGQGLPQLPAGARHQRHLPHVPRDARHRGVWRGGTAFAHRSCASARRR